MYMANFDVCITVLMYMSLSIKAKLPSVLLRGPTVLLRTERSVALLIKFQ